MILFQILHILHKYILTSSLSKIIKWGKFEIISVILFPVFFYIPWFIQAIIQITCEIIHDLFSFHIVAAADSNPDTSGCHILDGWGWIVKRIAVDCSAAVVGLGGGGGISSILTSSYWITASEASNERPTKIIQEVCKTKMKKRSTKNK